jgi:hypothetical protein
MSIKIGDRIKIDDYTKKRHYSNDPEYVGAEGIVLNICGKVVFVDLIKKPSGINLKELTDGSEFKFNIENVLPVKSYVLEEDV